MEDEELIVKHEPHDSVAGSVSMLSILWIMYISNEKKMFSKHK